MTAMGIGQAVDAVYVLSVKRFDRRIAHIRAEMAKYAIDFEFVFEHDADELTPATTAERFAPSDMKLAHQSLVLKHVRAWRNALDRGQRRILVFEDDVVLEPDFVPRLGKAVDAALLLPPGWLVFLGGADTKVPDRYFLADGPLVPLPIATAEGYVTDLEAIRRRLAWVDAHRIDLPADHLLRRLDAECGIAQYWVRPPLVEQGSVTGMFDSVLDTTRQKHSRTFNIMRNRWNKFQRHRLRGGWIRLRAALFGKACR